LKQEEASLNKHPFINFYFLICSLLFFKISFCQESTSDSDDNNSKKTQLVGEIPDSNLETVLKNRDQLDPIYGFEEIYIGLNKKNPNAKTGATISLEDIPEIKDIKDIYWSITIKEIVKFSREEMTQPGFPPKRAVIIATGQANTTQILAYDKYIDPETKKALPGKKLFKVFRVTVTDEDLVNLLQQIRAKMGKVEGLEMRLIGDRIVIDGQIIVPKDLRRVMTVYQGYKDSGKPVELLAEMSPLALQYIAEKMQDEINGGKDKPTNVYVRVLNGRFILEGAVDKQIEREIAVQTCQIMVQDQFKLEPKLVKETTFKDLAECLNRIRRRPPQAGEPDKDMSVRVDFVSLVRNYIKAFNFKWAPGVTTNSSYSYSSDIGKFAGAFQATLTGLFPTLETLSRNGHARVLKSATLILKDSGDGSPGPTASIGEVLKIPYFVPGNATNPASWQFADIQTNIAVAAVSIRSTDKILISLRANQAEIQDKPAPDAPPGSIQYSIDTQLVVSNGESAAIGGLISERRQVSAGRDPPNASYNDITLFKFSKTHEFQETKNQMIIFVTPTTLRSPSEGTDSLKRKFRLRR
jgi:pilus assembly protein CpaC